MAFWRVLCLLPLAACDREVTRSSTYLEVSGLPLEAPIGTPMTFSGEASRTVTTCTYCTSYDDGCENGVMNCKDAPPARAEIDQLHAAADRKECILHTSLNDDETTYSGTLTCPTDGMVYLTIALDTEDGTFQRTVGINVITPR